MWILDKRVGWKTHVVSEQVLRPTSAHNPHDKCQAHTEKKKPARGHRALTCPGCGTLTLHWLDPAGWCHASQGHCKLGISNLGGRPTQFRARLSPSFVLSLFWGWVSQFLFRLFSLKARLHGAMKIEILKFCMQTALKYFRPVSFQWRLSGEVWHLIEWDSGQLCNSHLLCVLT